LRKEHELKADIEAAQQADSIINHPLFIASLKTLHDSTIEEFKNLQNDSVEKMRECNMKLSVIDEFRDNLLYVLTKGNSAGETLEHLKEFDKAANQ
jgi:hypothetical protein